MSRGGATQRHNLDELKSGIADQAMFRQTEQYRSGPWNPSERRPFWGLLVWDSERRWGRGRSLRLHDPSLLNFRALYGISCGLLDLRA